MAACHHNSTKRIHGKHAPRGSFTISPFCASSVPHFSGLWPQKSFSALHREECPNSPKTSRGSKRLAERSCEWGNAGVCFTDVFYGTRKQIKKVSHAAVMTSNHSWTLHMYNSIYSRCSQCVFMTVGSIQLNCYIPDTMFTSTDYDVNILLHSALICHISSHIERPDCVCVYIIIIYQ